MSLDCLIKKNARDAVIHCIDIMGLKNPEKLVETEHGYIHVNTRGRKRLFVPMSCSQYFRNHKSDEAFRKKRLHKVMTFYITEEDIDERSADCA
jgi:hypothetical protein